MERDRKPDDPEQSQRFIDTAREIGADETEEGAERAFSKVAKPSSSGSSTRKVGARSPKSS
jgi:hypothetical protein